MKDLIKKDSFGDYEGLTKKGVKILVLLPIIVLFLISTLFSCFQTIKSGEVGLKVRFGKIVNSKLNEGFNFKIPYVEKIVIVNIKVQKKEVAVSGASKDLQDIFSKIAVNYRVSSTKANELYKTVGNSYDKVILDPTIQESVKAIFSQFTAEEIITERIEVSELCLELLKEKVSNYGIEIDNFNIIDLNFSDEYSKAIEEKQVAEQQVQTAKQKLEKTKIESEAKIVEAEAESKANQLKKESLTEEIIMQEFIKKWSGNLPTYYGNESGIFSIFGLDKNK